MRFTVDAYELPLATPFRIAYDTVTTSHNLLVRAEADGLIGHGEAGPVPTITGEDAAKTRTALDAWLRTAPQIAPPCPEPRLGLAGSLAVEAASLDLAAQRDGVPLCQHLTGRAPRPLSTSITIPIEDAPAAEARAAKHLAAGFRAFKVKTGAGLDDDLERVRVVRETVGGAEVRVDANQGWSLAEARRAAPVLADLGVDVLEQPLAKADLDGHRALVEDGVLPIMLDESVFSVADARRALDAGAADRINIKLQKTGGIHEALRIADLAQEAGVPCMIGCMIESRVAILAAAHVACAHDNIRWVDLDGHTFLAGDPVQGGATIVEGRLDVGGRPGLGIDGVHPTVAA